MPSDFGLPFLSEKNVKPKGQAQLEYEKFQQIQAVTLALGGKVVKRG
jgi:hypothetical protein